jgi:hypothetical protein
LYSSPSIIRIIKSRRMRWAGNVARMWEKRNAYRLLTGKQEGKRPLGRPRCRWVDNIRMDLREVGWGDVDWIFWLLSSPTLSKEPTQMSVLLVSISCTVKHVRYS